MDIKKALTRRLLMGEVCENCIHNGVFLKMRFFGKEKKVKGCKISRPQWKNDIRSCNMFFPSTTGFYNTALGNQHDV